jgi:hypothetical protein
MSLCHTVGRRETTSQFQEAAPFEISTGVFVLVVLSMTSWIVLSISPTRVVFV